MSTAAAKGFALLGCVLAFWNGPQAAAAWLQLGDSQIQDGVVYVPVIFDPGPDTVASLQFDVPFESRRFYFLYTEPGPAAISAGKDVLPGERQGKVTVVVAGLNQSAIGAGVLAGLYFELIPEGKGEARIALENHILSDPRGNAVAHQRPREEGAAGSEQPRNAPEDPPTETGNESAEPPGGTGSETQEDAVSSGASGDNRTALDPRLGGLGPGGGHGDLRDSSSADSVVAMPQGGRSESPGAGTSARHRPDQAPPAVMPERMPIVPARPAEARAQNGQPRLYHSGRSAEGPDEATSKAGRNSAATPFNEVADGDTSMPMSREQLAAIRAARSKTVSTMSQDDETGQTRALATSRPLPLGAMVFTGLAVLALLALALRRVGIWGAGRRSIRT